MENSLKPPSPIQRLSSHLQKGPSAIARRWADVGHRRIRGGPVWAQSEITPQLFVGGQHYYGRGLRALRSRGITATVNMREKRHCDVAKGIAGARRLHLPTADNTPPAVADLMRGARFVREELERGGKVYIHCAVGCGRAPTMAAACLISAGLSPNAAIARITRVRPFINLTGGQRQVLDDFERSWLDAQPEPPCPA